MVTGTIFKLGTCHFFFFSNIPKGQITFGMGPFCKTAETSGFPKHCLPKDRNFAVVCKSDEGKFYDAHAHCKYSRVHDNEHDLFECSVHCGKCALL